MLEITTSWEGGYRCRVPIRDFEVLVDEPTTVGGTDTGPTPTELLLASLGACFTLAVAHVARKRGRELPDLRLRVRGEYRGAGFDRIIVEATSSAPELAAVRARPGDPNQLRLQHDPRTARDRVPGGARGG